VTGSGIGPATTVGLGVGAEVVGGDGFGRTSGCLESSETQITDAVRTTRRATSRPPPATACTETRRRTTVGSERPDCSARAATRTSVPVAAADRGDVGPSSIEPTRTGSRTSTILLDNSVGCLMGDRGRDRAVRSGPRPQQKSSNHCHSLLQDRRHHPRRVERNRHPHAGLRLLVGSARSTQLGAARLGAYCLASSLCVTCHAL
jgi:hypothetical protein